MSDGRCRKPGCGALAAIGDPCTDYDCPQRFVSAADHRAEIGSLRAELAKVREECETVCNSYVDENQRLSDRIAAAEARALAAEARMGEVVKALEWREEHGYAARAEHPFGVYAITAAGIGRPVKLEGGDHIARWFATVDEAKAAAQADYEARVRSALAKENDRG